MRPTLLDLTIARVARLYDGVALEHEGQIQGAVYVLGYHIEMSLKIASFRALGRPPTATVDRLALRTIRQQARLCGVDTPHGAYHSLPFWADVLVALRAAVGRPCDPALANDLLGHVERARRVWHAGLRYEGTAPSSDFLDAMVAAANWFDHHLHRL